MPAKPETPAPATSKKQKKKKKRQKVKRNPKVDRDGLFIGACYDDWGQKWPDDDFPGFRGD